jgi:hypothetical protein
MYGFLNRFVVRTGTHFTSLGTAALNRAALRVISPLQYLIGVACLLIVTLALLEPASSAGLNLPHRAFFWFLHLVPATMLAWVISGWLFNTRASRHVSPGAVTRCSRRCWVRCEGFPIRHGLPPYQALPIGLWRYRWVGCWRTRLGWGQRGSGPGSSLLSLEQQ